MEDKVLLKYYNNQYHDGDLVDIDDTVLMYREIVNNYKVEISELKYIIEKYRNKCGELIHQKQLITDEYERVQNSNEFGKGKSVKELLQVKKKIKEQKRRIK